MNDYYTQTSDFVLNNEHSINERKLHQQIKYQYAASGGGKWVT